MTKPPAESPEQGFLERWSRRKAAARSGEPLEDAAPALQEAPDEGRGAEAGEDGAAAEEAALSDAELAERFGLPDPAAMEKGADFSAFMKEGVPHRLRNLALRRLWASSPELGAVDGLLDYGEDFTGAGVVGALQTAYEVGSGFKKRIEAWEKEQAEKEAEGQDGAAETELEAEVAAAGSVAADRPDKSGGAKQADDRAASLPQDEADAREAQNASALATRRRMRFRFDASDQG